MTFRELLQELLHEIDEDRVFLEIYNQFADAIGYERIWEDLDDMFEGSEEGPTWFINRWRFGTDTQYTDPISYLYTLDGGGNIQVIRNLKEFVLDNKDEILDYYEDKGGISEVQVIDDLYLDEYLGKNKDK